MNRIYLFQSSSTKLAIFFSMLLIVALVLLSVEIYALTHGEIMRPIFTKFILGLVIFICGGLFFISFHVTKRINTITETADRIITTRDLTQRIPIDNPWDDLSMLAGALNAMLEEIEQLVNGTRQVTDNIAHDLRTPLTRLRNHIESMRDDAVETAQVEGFTGLIDECDALLVTFNALLRIANIEVGRRHTSFHSFDLAPVIGDVVEFYEPVANEHNITLKFTSRLTHTIGDKDLLFQAAANLLDNALKHTPDGGTVEVSVAPFQRKSRLTIRDSGEGISDEHKPHVFRRFYRITTSRNTPGSGLGLSLVQAIIHRHKGTITLTDNKPTGLVITIDI